MQVFGENQNNLLAKNEGDASKSKTLTREEIEKNAVPGRLAELEKKLQERIQALPDAELKKQLSERAVRDNETIKTTSIYVLDDSNTSWKLSPPNGPNGLTDFQAETRKFFADQRKINDQTANDKLNEILSILDELHLTQQALLRKKLDEASHETYSYGELQREYHFGDEEINVREQDKKGPPKSHLIQVLSSIADNTLRDPITGKSIRLDTASGSITGDDPGFVGKSLASAGYRSVIISGPPKTALATGLTALASGVLRVKFDDKDGTDQAIKSRSSFTSETEYLSAQRELEAINEINKAYEKVLTKRGEHTIEEPLNPDQKNRMSRLAEVFITMDTGRPGHRELLEYMSPEDRANLAYMLDEKGYTFTRQRQNEKTGEPIAMTLTGEQYVRGLLRSMVADRKIPKEHLSQFETTLIDKKAEKAHQEIDKAKKNEAKDPFAVANIIAKQNPSVRRKLYSSDKLSNEDRARLLGLAHDRYLTDIMGLKSFNPIRRAWQGNQLLREFREEAKAILSVPADHRAQILKSFDDHYNRAIGKYSQHAQQYPGKVSLHTGSIRGELHKEYDLKGIYKKNASFYDYSEIRDEKGQPLPGNAKLLETQPHFDMYARLLGQLDIVEKELAKADKKSPDSEEKPGIEPYLELEDQEEKNEPGAVNQENKNGPSP